MTQAKLPDVWVMFDGLIPSDVALRRSPDDSDAPVHRYTPAKPAKVCAWSQRDGLDRTSVWVNCEGEWFGDDPYTFCPCCGGKIKVTR